MTLWIDHSSLITNAWMVFSLESLPFRGWLASSPNMSSHKTIEASSGGLQDLSAISHDMAIN